jgi:hypothetical protein
VTVSSSAWTCAGLRLRPAYRRDLGVCVDAPRRYTTLEPEQARALRDWLTGWLDDAGAAPPAVPDTVRAAIDAQRAALRARSAEACSEDFRAGLSWADLALRIVADAAGAVT